MGVCVYVCVCVDGVFRELSSVGVLASENILVSENFLREHAQFQHYTYGLVSGGPWQSLGKDLLLLTTRELMLATCYFSVPVTRYSPLATTCLTACYPSTLFNHPTI